MLNAKKYRIIKKGEYVIVCEKHNNIMEMKTKTHKVVKSESLWAVEYSVICENEEILRQRLEWNIQYLS